MAFSFLFLSFLFFLVLVLMPKKKMWGMEGGGL